MGLGHEGTPEVTVIVVPREKLRRFPPFRASLRIGSALNFPGLGRTPMGGGGTPLIAASVGTVIASAAGFKAPTYVCMMLSLSFQRSLFPSLRLFAGR
jgi:hypothetical protein